MKTYRERTEEILEKAKTIKRKRSARNKKLAAGISCSLAAVLAVNLAIFLPSRGGDKMLDQAVGSPQTVGGVLTGATGKQAGSYEEVVNTLGGMFASGGNEWNSEGDVSGPATDSDHTEDGSSAGGSSVVRECIDLETEGIVEGTFFARGEDMAFCLTENSLGAVYAPSLVLQAYTLEETPTLLGSVAIKAEEDFRFNCQSRAIYLNEDGDSVTVLANMSDTQKRLSYVAIYTVDVEKPHTMSVIKAQFLSGELLTSRSIGGDLIIFTQYIPKGLGSEKDFLPQHGDLKEMKSIPAGNIFLPACVSSPVFTVFTALNKSGAYLDSCAALSLAGPVYFTREACYVTGTHEKLFDMNCGAVSAKGVQTDLVRIPIGSDGTFGSPAHATFAGAIKDSTCINCYGGTLRIAATVDAQYASLYILDAKTLEAVAAAENFAPAGETVLAATFEKERAFISTGTAQQTHRFCFDLSDPKKISYQIISAPEN